MFSSHLSPARPTADALAAASPVLDAVLAQPTPDIAAVGRAVLAALLPQVDGALSASVTQRPDPGRWVTVAASDELAIRVDGAQYALGDGPCLRAVDGAVVAADEAELRRHWPALADQVVSGTRSVRC